MALAEQKVPGAAFNGTSVSVDHAGYLAQHDIVYGSPPRLGEEGMPIGDGDLGAMIWCPPGEIRIQINKSDLWWENTYAKPGRFEDWQLLSAGGLCIRTDPSPLRAPTFFEQRLNLYQAQVTLQASAPDGTCEATAWAPATGGVLCLDYDDRILRAKNRTVELAAWRNARPFALGEYIGLIEALPDRRYAMLCRLVGQPAQAGWKDGHTAQFNVPSMRGARFTLYITVAITGRDGDPVSIAKVRLEKAIERGATVLLNEHKMHWRAFWQKSFLRLVSPDGTADYVENLWYFNLYQLASCSRGLYTPKFNGGLWTTQQDERAWGGGYWHWNTQMLYWPTFASNHLELTHAYFETIARMQPVVERETKARFQTGGARFPEITNRFGEDIAGPQDQGVSLILSGGLEAAMQFWWCWQFTQDYAFLRERVYPLLKACVQFYQDYAQPDTDERIMIYPSNAYESRTNVKNAPNDLAALRFGLKALIEASEELDEDEEERLKWKAMLQRIPDYPTQSGRDIWSRGIGGHEGINAQRPELAPIFPSGEVGIGSSDYTRAVRTFQENAEGFNAYGWSIDTIVAARLGMRDEMAGLLKQHVEKFQIYPQGLYHYTTKVSHEPSDRIPYLEPLGVMSTALNEMCVQGHEGLIRIFPALPPGWDGTFMLRAAGGLIVMAETEGGVVLWAALHSLTQQRCRLMNPWSETARVLNGRQELVRTDDAVLEFDTEVGQIYTIDRPSRPLSRMLRLRLSGKRNSEPKQLGPRHIGLC